MCYLVSGLRVLYCILSLQYVSNNCPHVIYLVVFESNFTPSCFVLIRETGERQLLPYFKEHVSYVQP